MDHHENLISIHQWGEEMEPVIKSIDEPLTREEQDDLFNQMRKNLESNEGVVKDRHFLSCEHENMYRMKATIYQMRKTIEGGDAAINHLEVEADILRRERDNYRQALHVIARLADTGSSEHIAEFGNESRPTGWMVACAMRDVAISNIGNDPVLTDMVVHPGWLDDQDWLWKEEDERAFQKYVGFGGRKRSAKRFEIYWHAACEHVGEWATLYIGKSVTQSNPTITQVLAFKKAFESLL